MRDAPHNTPVTPEAIDATLRKDALTTAQTTLGDRVRNDLDSALSRLPDLIPDVPPD
jgi:hypothetical protein